jgi:hypothetical protein
VIIVHRRTVRTSLLLTLALAVTSAGAVLGSSAQASSGSASTRTGLAPYGSGTHYFGSLRTDPARAAAEAPTMKLAMVEMSWGRAQPNGPGSFDDAYLAGIRDQVDAFRAAGREVVLGVGLHYEPQWVFDLSSMRNQAGTLRTDQANLVFSQAVRSALNTYLQHADTIISFDRLWGVRVNVAGAQGEIQYPDSNYWAFSTGAQNGADKPTRLAPNPYPGWKPATGDTSLSVAQVEEWAQWYQGALANALDEQMDTLSATGFRGYFFLISAGSGARPSTWDAAVAGKLQTTSLVGRGVAWDKLYADLAPRANVVAYSSSTAESTSYNACTSADASVPLTSTSANSWSAGRWLTRVAHENGLQMAGENPGYADSNTYYSDTSSSGMMARAFELTTSCGYLAFFWAHDAQLWNADLPGTSYSRYAALIDDANGGSNPRPPFPA